MLRQKREKSGTGICHVMKGKESNLSLRFTAKEYKKEKQNGHLSCDAPCEHRTVTYSNVGYTIGSLIIRKIRGK